MTKAFVALSAAIYLMLALESGGFGLLSTVRPSVALRWGALAGQLGSLEPFRYVSAMFVHFSLLHVGLNCMALLSLGRGVEEGDGSASLVVLFVGTGALGFVASDAWPGPSPLTGGISGGVFGLLGAYAGRRYAQGDPDWKRLALTGVGYAVAMALLMPNQINNAAHVGGLVSGGVLAWATYVFARGPLGRRVMRWASIALVCCTVGSIAASHLSPAWRVIQARESFY